MYYTEFDPQCIMIIHKLPFKKWGLWDSSVLSEATQVSCDQARILTPRVQ